MSILTAICEEKKKSLEAAKRERPLALVQEGARSVTAPRFVRALKNAPYPAVIAEVKKASPSKGIIRSDLQPGQTAASFARRGAAALSVLTEEKFFQGGLDWLAIVRRALADEGRSEVPILRKDFIIDPYQVWETKAAGASALLLIAAALDERLFKALLNELASAGEVDVLVEVHNEEDVEKTFAVLEGVPLTGFELAFGINNRDLQTFHTDIDQTAKIAPLVLRLAEKAGQPELSQPLLVAESGIFSGRDVYTLHEKGARAFLIGESLVASGGPGDNLAALISAARKEYEAQNKD